MIREQRQEGVVMAELTSLDREYKEGIRFVSQKYRQSQIKAAVSVNRELIAFYWNLGKDISEREKEWGTGFYKMISSDMKKLLPDCSGFAERKLLMKNCHKLWQNLMRRIYSLFRGDITG